MLSSKIYITYEIKEPPPYYKPKDFLKGTMFMTNNDKKDTKFKEVYIELFELYLKYISGAKGNKWHLIHQREGRLHFYVIH